LFPSRNRKFRSHGTRPVRIRIGWAPRWEAHRAWRAATEGSPKSRFASSHFCLATVSQAVAISNSCFLCSGFFAVAAKPRHSSAYSLYCATSSTTAPNSRDRSPSSNKPGDLRPSRCDAPNPPHGVSCHEGAWDCVRPPSPSQ